VSDFEARRARLAELLKRDALRVAPEGETFTLASGKQSRYFVNGKEVTLRAEGLALVASLFLDRLRGSGAQAVGGMSIGADPMIGAVVALSAATDEPLQGFIVRKTAKDHGLLDAIAGPSLADVRSVALVEDVTTTGGSTLAAIEAVKAAWPHVTIAKVLTVLDRQEGAAEAFAQAGYELDALLRREELGVA
jgi:orotate phosphoribosyltransferase